MYRQCSRLITVAHTAAARIAIIRIVTMAIAVIAAW